MAARLQPAPNSCWPHLLDLGPWVPGACPLEAVRHGLGADHPLGAVQLHSGGWPLGYTQLNGLKQLLSNAGLQLQLLVAAEPTTLVAAAALGWPCCPASQASGEQEKAISQQEPALHVHRGTVRSGEHLEISGSLLVLGDVNPGARVSASGDVLVWGRLRGVAHAGSNGNPQARIVALQLRPLQLRIAAAVARGPQEPPPEGLSEQAELVDGEIRIRAAQPGLPLNVGSSQRHPSSPPRP